jgi:chemotaxis protein MotB
VKVQDNTDSTAALDLAGVGAVGTAGQTKTTTPAEDAAITKGVQAADRARQQKMQADAEREIKDFDQVKKKIADQAKLTGVSESVRFTIDERGLVVTIVTSGIVFAGDRAELLPAGRRILDSVAPALIPLTNHIEVDGHTNQLAVPTLNYPSAWELSTARASDVVRYLIGSGLPAARLSAVGYAGEKPLYPPADPRAATLNRRVEIVVRSQLADAAHGLLASSAATK